MAGQKTEPPWDFLVSASPFALQSYELSRLNLAANLRKEVQRLLDQWVEETSCALLARWLLEQQARSRSCAELPAAAAAGASASHNSLTEFPAG